MLTIITSLGAAIVLAVLGAVCFAAATLHHRAIGASFGQERITDRRLDLSRLWLLINTRGWLAGTALVGLGAGLHVIALLLAPVSIIQPVGVLAVPLAVLFGSWLRPSRPSGRLLGFTTMTVAGIAIFVVLAVTHDSPVHEIRDDWTVWVTGLLTVPEVVLGALNVVDPLVAVLFGVLVLGEGDLLTPLVVAAMTVLGALAAVGVLLLARYHPEVRTPPALAA